MTTHTLSEAASRRLASAAGIAVSPFLEVTTAAQALQGPDQLAFPVVAKLCGDTIAHKSERGLVRLDLADAAELESAVDDLLAASTPDDGDVTVLVSTMVEGRRELIAGVTTDPQFGKTIMLGVGGVLAEAIADVVFRLIPIAANDAHEMIDQLRSQTLLGAFRGEPELDRDALVATLVALSNLADTTPDIVSVDLNPLIITDGVPVAVDALIERAGDRDTTGDSQ